MSKEKYVKDAKKKKATLYFNSLWIKGTWLRREGAGNVLAQLVQLKGWNTELTAGLQRNLHLNIIIVFQKQPYFSPCTWHFVGM